MPLFAPPTPPPSSSPGRPAGDALFVGDDARSRWPSTAGEDLSQAPPLALAPPATGFPRQAPSVPLALRPARPGAGSGAASAPAAPRNRRWPGRADIHRGRLLAALLLLALGLVLLAVLISPAVPEQPRGALGAGRPSPVAGLFVPPSLPTPHFGSAQPSLIPATATPKPARARSARARATGRPAPTPAQASTVAPSASPSGGPITQPPIPTPTPLPTPTPTALPTPTPLPVHTTFSGTIATPAICPGGAVSGSSCLFPVTTTAPGPMILTLIAGAGASDCVSLVNAGVTVVAPTCGPGTIVVTTGSLAPAGYSVVVSGSAANGFSLDVRHY